MPTDLPNERSIRPAGSMELDPSAEGVAIDETSRLIASNKVEGTAAYRRDGEHIGTVYNFMVDKVSGQVAYAVLSFGGFLGLGESYHPVPWRALTYSVELGGYIVDIDRDTLEGAPTHGPGEDPFADPRYGERVDGHYGGSKVPTA
ncbi:MULTISPECIES: PRC-barrel domain-containing protein [unclassified Methylobacterium]|uniref:PRC-barrel domain-containing protein n=1 Tax=unclassified Methylobacterium TaxID=2615210 RepID=UPI0006FED941|nr:MULTISPECIES: PRC-barrel domain-containing protein [unclassified Methylobacterium]KQP82825.1 photosystem reaction center subunit H [Methylobacterium sp. Leaf117]MCK2054828.1 PRC-barrel domain-containing protein [Methylobacterium sp. 37f]